MIKQWAILLIGSAVLFSCSNGGSETAAKPAGMDTAAIKKQRFFPVTSFLGGDLAAVKSKAVTPLKTTVQNQKTDSAWLTLEQLAVEVAPFMQPVIDSTNLIMLFKETSFQDQTINTFTFTYEPWGTLPDSMPLRRWDVYVDADKQTVKRVYMVKQIQENNQPKTQQLTWEAGRYCKIVTLKPDNSGVEKAVTISWDF